MILFSSSQRRAAREALLRIGRNVSGPAVARQWCAGFASWWLHRFLLCLKLLWYVSGALIFAVVLELKSYLLNVFLKKEEWRIA